MAAKCIPIGYRFLPTEEELITHYLAEKIRGNPLPWNCIVEKQLYGENADPWKVFSRDDQWVISDETTDGRMVIYVFTKLTKMGMNPKRISRTAGSGLWHRTTLTETPVKNSRGDQIGSKKVFAFEGKSGVKIDHDQCGRWRMYEFSCVNDNNYVVCKITTSWNNAREDRRAAEEDIAQVSIPIGYRFLPTDEELITHYLAKKLQEKPLPWNCIVEKQLYGENADPWKVFSEQDQWVSEKTTDDVEKGIKTVKKAIYVFTQLTKLGSKNISRTAGCGSWRRQWARETPVKNSSGDQIGSKNKFSFQGKSGVKIDDNRYGQWMMHEFSGVTDNNNYVVCKITATWNINVKDHSNKRPVIHQQVEEDGSLMNKKQKTTSDDVLVQDQDSSIALDNVDELVEIGHDLAELLDDDNGPM